MVVVTDDALAAIRSEMEKACQSPPAPQRQLPSPVSDHQLASATRTVQLLRASLAYGNDHEADDVSSESVLATLVGLDLFRLVCRR
jgi:hypothetical protein